MKALEDLDLGESLLPGLQMGTFWLCPHKVESERALASSSSIRTHSYDGGPTLMASSNANYLLKPHLQIPSHGTLTHEFGGQETKAFSL